MSSILTHPVVPVAISFLFPRETVTPKLVILGAACAVIPDLDVIGFRFGVSYDDMLGHRGLSHSIAFAAALAALLGFVFFRDRKDLRLKILYLFLSTLSHTLLDMLTNGGLGVALFAPVSNERFFFPFRPIEVSPLGIRNFFSLTGIEVILNELKWVWLPSFLVATAGFFVRHVYSSKVSETE